MNDPVKTENPAFGTIQFSRVQSNPKIPLFGSNVKHGNFIMMRINKACQYRELHYDRVFPNELIIEAYMSNIQLLDAITNLNNGSGIPITFKYLNGTQIPDIPFEGKREKSEKEFQSYCSKVVNEFSDDVDIIVNLLSTKQSLSKADREFILKTFSQVKMKIQSNIPFISECFTREMNEIVLECKGEIEAFFQDKIQTMGLQSIQENPVLIEDKTNEESK